MWLPVLLYRDFRDPEAPIDWAFLAFALPNCLGAAAMGFVLSRPGASERFCAAHAPACLSFSAVTVAFQWFFLTVTLLAHGFTPLGMFLIAAALVVRGLSGPLLRRDGAARVFSIGIYLLSAALFAFWLVAGASEPISPLLLPSSPEPGLGFIAAACVFGFTLCPYLDLTFHRAASGSDDSFGRTAAFGIGFLLLFAVMILFTRSYAPHVIAAATEKGYNLGPGFLAPAVALHIVIQLMFTIACHDAAAQPRSHAHPAPSPLPPPSAPDEGVSTPANPLWRSAVLFSPLVGVGAALLSPLGVPGVGRYSCNETVYRIFMGCYGLLFPAYVLLCAAPNAASGVPPSGRQRIIWAVACAVTLPMFAAAFLFHLPHWLAPALILLAFAAIPAWVVRPRTAEPQSPIQD